MPKITDVFLRDGIYYFRKRIPQDLLELYHPQKEIKFSLETSIYSEAKERRDIHAGRIALEFKLKRKLLSPPLDEITESKAKDLASAWALGLLKDDEQSRKTASWLVDREAIKNGVDEALLEWSDLGLSSFANGTPIHQFKPMDDYLLSRGIRYKPSSTSYQLLAHKFLEAGIFAMQAIQKRYQGDDTETTVLAGILSKANVATTNETTVVPLLSDVVKYFLDTFAKDKKSAMYRKHTTVLPMFLEWIGDKPVSEIKQMDIEGYFLGICKLPPRWSDLCRQQGKTPKQLAQEAHPKCIARKTYEDTYQASVRPFVRVSKRRFGDSGFPVNLTAEGIEYTGTRHESENKQRAFKLDELKRLFEGAAYKALANDPSSSHKYWLPLVGLYTGARVNEVCQLNPQVDVIQCEHTDILYFNITEQGEASEGVKNKVSVREVPIHEELIKLGFLEYVEGLKLSGAKLLFPSFAPAKGRAADEAEEWFVQFIIETGLRDDTLGKKLVGFHAFRHNLETYAYNMDVDVDVIIGHAGEVSHVKRNYRSWRLLVKKKEVLDKIRFDLVVPIRTEYHPA